MIAHLHPGAWVRTSITEENQVPLIGTRRREVKGTRAGWLAGLLAGVCGWWSRPTHLLDEEQQQQQEQVPLGENQKRSLLECWRVEEADWVLFPRISKVSTPIHLFFFYFFFFFFFYFRFLWHSQSPEREQHLVVVVAAPFCSAGKPPSSQTSLATTAQSRGRPKSLFRGVSTQNLILPAWAPGTGSSTQVQSCLSVVLLFCFFW